jgi:hypothetical protein
MVQRAWLMAALGASLIPILVACTGSNPGGDSCTHVNCNENGAYTKVGYAPESASYDPATNTIHTTVLVGTSQWVLCPLGMSQVVSHTFSATGMASELVVPETLCFAHIHRTALAFVPHLSEQHARMRVARSAGRKKELSGFCSVRRPPFSCSLRARAKSGHVVFLVGVTSGLDAGCRQQPPEHHDAELADSAILRGDAPC